MCVCVCMYACWFLFSNFYLNSPLSDYSREKCLRPSLCDLSCIYSFCVLINAYVQCYIYIQYFSKGVFFFF